MFRSVAQTSIALTVGILLITAAVVLALGGGAAEAALWAGVLALASRVVPILGSCLIAYWPRRSHRVPFLGVTGLMRTVALEAWATVKLFFFYHPFENLVTRQEPNSVVAGQTPIVLVHGFYSNAGFWQRMKKELEAAGWQNLFSLNLEPLFIDIDDYAVQLQERIEDVCTKTGCASVVILAHSMGGLVARACMRRAPERIRHVICLGSPHRGTVLASLVPTQTTRQMRLRSEWLRELNEDESTNSAYTNLYSEHDNIIVPQTSATLKDANNLPLRGVGHLEMAFSPAVSNRVKDILAGI